MSQVHEVLKKFDEFETSMKMHLAKVDPRLIVDLLLRQKKEPNNKNPIYTLEVFIKPNQSTDEIRNRIIEGNRHGHCILRWRNSHSGSHRINFDMLKMINDIETVERIRGTYSGGGMASIGPVYD